MQWWGQQQLGQKEKSASSLQEGERGGEPSRGKEKEKEQPCCWNLQKPLIPAGEKLFIYKAKLAALKDMRRAVLDQAHWVAAFRSHSDQCANGS